MPLSTGLKLPKSGRIHHRSLQEKLFASGKKLHEYPLKAVWNTLTEDELRANFRDRVPDLIGPLQVLVSVPKKKRRKAVDRVLMRRRIREAFRLNRATLMTAIGESGHVRTMSVGIIYMKEENAPYAAIEEKMRKILTRLAEKVREEPATKEEPKEKKKEQKTGQQTDEETALAAADTPD